jgi:hypothetical protein
MSFPVIGAAGAVPVHQYTRNVVVGDWNNGKITIPKTVHKLDEPVVSVQKAVAGGKHRHVGVEEISVDDSTKDVTVTIPLGAEFAGKIIIN